MRKRKEIREEIKFDMKPYDDTPPPPPQPSHYASLFSFRSTKQTPKGLSGYSCEATRLKSLSCKCIRNDGFQANLIFFYNCLIKKKLIIFLLIL